MSIPRRIRSIPDGSALPTGEVRDTENIQRTPEVLAFEAIRSEGTKRDSAIAALKDFLSQKAGGERSRPRKACGATMQHLDAYFWLDGTNVASLVPLPFCPACDPDVLTSLRRKRAVPLGLAS